MSDTKSPLEGMTIGEFRRLTTGPLVALGRAMAPAINIGLGGLGHAQKIKRPKLEPSDYCPGCGEVSWNAPDLCPECLAFNAG